MFKRFLYLSLMYRDQVGPTGDSFLTVVVVWIKQRVVTVKGINIKKTVQVKIIPNTFVEVLTVDMWVEILIIVPNMAVDLVMDALTEMIRGIRTSIGVDVLMDVNVNAFVGVMVVFEFVTSDTLEGFCCWAACDCRPMAAALDCASTLQAWIPS